MATGDIETYYEGGHWKNRVEGSGQAAHVHNSLAKAKVKGRAMAINRKVAHVIRQQDGTIAEKRSYRRDAADIPD